jgi:hypothetical protein
MVTEVEERIDWGSFMTDSLAEERIDNFRKSEWRHICHELQSQFGLAFVHEPCWTDVGEAVFWQPQITRKRVDGAVENVNEGWQITGPLPANNASQIMHYIRKGFLLRPPSYGESVEEYEAAEPAGGSRGPIQQVWCDAHVRQRFSFATWDGYIRHCAHFKEPVVSKPPHSVVKAAARFNLYCLEHNTGYNSERLAHRHMREALHTNELIRATGDKSDITPSIARGRKRKAKNKFGRGRAARKALVSKGQGNGTPTL